MLSVAFLLPERLPSPILLLGFWIPPALGGWALAAGIQRRSHQPRIWQRLLLLTLIAAACAGLWFLVNVGRMPPYIPGALPDPSVATPRAIGWLALMTAAIILPGSLIAGLATFRIRMQTP